MIDKLRQAAHQCGDRMVGLPGPVAARLGRPARARASEYLTSALDWLGQRPARALCSCADDEVVYQVFVECFAGFKNEPGTLASLLCRLPFIVEDLGATAILTLPLLARGQSERKGESSSPFAISSREQIEPGVGGFDDALSAGEAWVALVATCARIGVRLGMVMPMATIAIDSELIPAQPELVYWWRAGLDERLMGTATGDQRLAPEAVPAQAALQRFAAPPRADRVSTVSGPRGPRHVVRLPGQPALTVANAYPDPVVRDDSTYAWSDVAALRFGPAIAPTAYRQDQPAPGPVPQATRTHLRELLAHSRRRGESVLLADVSSALPDEMLDELCQPYPQQLVVSEHLWSFQDRESFEFVTGPLIPCVAAHHRDEGVLAQSLAHHLSLLASTPDTPRYFAGVANHDSLPCPADIAECLLTAFVLLPGSVPFLYSGTEWDCGVATNLEFGSFESAEAVPAQGLLLFNHRPMTVDEARLVAFTAFWNGVLRLRRSLGTAAMPASSLRNVRLSGALVRFSVGPLEIVVNTGAQSAHTDGANDRFGFMLATRDFDLDGARLNIAPRSTVVIAPAGCRLPAEMSGAFRCLEGLAGHPA